MPKDGQAADRDVVCRLLQAISSFQLLPRRLHERCADNAVGVRASQVGPPTQVPEICCTRRQNSRVIYRTDLDRRIPVDLAPLVSQLLTICSRDTCPRMKADEWLYLCVAHGSGGTEECCAIDYILHTCVIFLLGIF